MREMQNIITSARDESYSLDTISFVSMLDTYMFVFERHLEIYKTEANSFIHTCVDPKTNDSIEFMN